MDPNLLLGAICIGISLLILVMVAVIGRGMSLRASLWWIGLACLPIAALVSGMVPYLINAWNELFATVGPSWWSSLTQPFSGPVTAGLVAGGLGLLLMIGSRLVPYKKRQKKPKKDKIAPGATASRTRPDYSAPTSSSTTPTDVTAP